MDTKQSQPLHLPKSRKPSASAAQVWLIPGESDWEIWTQNTPGDFAKVRTLTAEDNEPPANVTTVCLPTKMVTCQLFWLETTEESTVPDLLRMQCERRQLLREDQVWTHRIVRREPSRLLVQIIILQNAIPPQIEVETSARFEAMPRCLDLPPRTVSVWRSLGTVSLTITDEEGVVYFQPLPHRDLTTECLQDVRATIMMAVAQKWVSGMDSFVLVGDWNNTPSPPIESVLGVGVSRMPIGHLVEPESKMELTPRTVKAQRLSRQRQRRIKFGVLALAALYAVFVAIQLFTFVLSSGANARLKSELDGIMPDVADMQNTARWMDALNPALDAKTYPLEILYRTMAALPTQGVRLTRMEITGDRIEIGGESSTAREAFGYIQALEDADSLNHITWDEAPQPIPLPNDTTRFSITGTIEGAYRDADPEES